VEDKLKRLLVLAFEHTLDNFAIGAIGHQEKATNFRLYRFDSTTASTANSEFTIYHGLGQTPIHLVPYLPLDSSAAKVVRLEVTRPADGQRVYLRSPEVSAPISVLIEV
jgi:hypothetical protein